MVIYDRLLWGLRFTYDLGSLNSWGLKTCLKNVYKSNAEGPIQMDQKSEKTHPAAKNVVAGKNLPHIPFRHALNTFRT